MPTSSVNNAAIKRLFARADSVLTKSRTVARSSPADEAAYIALVLLHVAHNRTEEFDPIEMLLPIVAKSEREQLDLVEHFRGQSEIIRSDIFSPNEPEIPNFASDTSDASFDNFEPTLAAVESNTEIKEVPLTQRISLDLLEVGSRILTWLRSLLKIRRQTLLRSLASNLAERVTLSIPSTGYSERWHDQTIKSLSTYQKSRNKTLDLSSTIDKTITNGGYPTLVWKAKHSPKTYVALLHRRSFADLEYQRIVSILQSLRKNGLPVVMFSYSHDPRYVLPINHSVKGDQQELLVSKIADLYADAVLLLFSDGQELSDPFTLKPKSWLQNLTLWKKWALLTPMPIETWGRLEHQLSESAGFYISTSQADGFARLAEILNNDVRLFSSVHHSNSFTPEYLIRESAAPFRHETPQTSDQNKIVGDLKAYLGIWGFRWFSACAFYPHLRKDVSLALADRLSDTPDSREMDDLQHKLFNLVWYRIGSVPIWLRNKLFNSLPRNQRKDVSRAVADLFDQCSIVPFSETDRIADGTGRDARISIVSSDQGIGDVQVDATTIGLLADRISSDAAKALQRLAKRILDDPEEQNRLHQPRETKKLPETAEREDPKSINPSNGQTMPAQNLVTPERTTDVNEDVNSNRWNNRIFISRSGADIETAAWMTRVLEAEGFECISQDRDFEIGEKFVQNMREAFESCDTVIAIMSPDYWESDFCASEWDAAFALFIGGQGNLIPVMARASEPPKLYIDVAYLDLLRLKETEKEAALTSAVTGVIKSNSPPPDRYPSQSLPVANSAFVTSNFFGREEELAELSETLWFNRELIKSTPPTVITGLGGVGKSAIAREYARRNQHRYAGTWLVLGENIESMLEDLSALAIRLNPSLTEAMDIEAIADQAFNEALLLAKTKGQPFLFVFDNIGREGDVPAASIRPEFHVIVTSRWKAWKNAKQIEIQSLPKVAARELMLSMSGREADEEGFDDLMEALNGLTLSIVQAGSYLRENELESFSDYHSKLTSRMGQRAIGADASEKLVASTFVPSIEKAEQEAPGAQELLLYTAFLAPDDIPIILLNDETKPRQSRSVANTLLRYSLIQQGSPSEAFGPSISIHRILQSTLKAEPSDALRAKLLSELSKRIEKLLADTSGGDVRDWPKIIPLVPHILALNESDEQAFGGISLASVSNIVAEFLIARANYASAESLIRRTLQVLERSVGPKHAATAMASSNLARLLMETNRIEEAEHIYRRVLYINEELHGPNDPQTANTLSDLSETLRISGRLEEAEPLIRRAMEIDEVSYGPDHPLLAIKLNNLAEVLKATNRLEEAEPLYRRALAISESRYGAEHPNTAIGLNNLATLLNQTNRSHEAEIVGRRALSIYESAFGPDHPNVAGVLSNLALILSGAGEFLKALPLLERANSILERSLPDGHPQLLKIKQNLELVRSQI